MNVLYDISELGKGQAIPKYRTGVYRVVGSVADQLVQSAECRLEFSATEYQFDAERHVAQHPRLSHIPVSFERRKGRLNQKFSETLEAVQSASPVQRLYLRPRRKMLNLAMRALQNEDYPLDQGAVRRAEVFHSSGLTALFPQVQQAPHLKCVQTVYDLIPIRQPQYLDSDCLLHLFHRIVTSIGPDDWAVCISQATKDDLCEYTGMDPARAIVTPLAADQGLFFPCPDPARQEAVRRKYKIPDAPYFLSLCTLEPRKNLDHLIRCFVRLVRAQKIKDLNLVLAGGKGWLFDNLFAELDAGEAAALRDRIIVTGYVDNEDLAALYSGAIGFVFPSLIEGFGLPPLEAMQCGVPVITSNTSSLPEVVGDGGLMVDPTDEDALCQSLLDVVSDTTLRRSLSQRALMRSKEFSWERCARETVAAYRLAVNS